MKLSPCPWNWWYLGIYLQLAWTAGLHGQSGDDGPAGREALPSSSGSLLPSETPSPPAENPAAAISPSSSETAPLTSVDRLIETETERTAPVQSEKGINARLFRIPAPRGIVVDRKGRPLIQTRAADYLAIRLRQFRDHGSGEVAFAEVKMALENLPDLDLPGLNLFEMSPADFAAHGEHRPLLPFPVSPPLSAEQAKGLAELVAATPWLALETRFIREYPEGERAFHLTGYVRDTMPFQHGPLSSRENLWPEAVGASGWEKVYEEELRGTPGLASYLYSDDGVVVGIELIEAAIPGDTIVMTIDRPMQELAYQILEESAQPGALVVMDSLTGDILAMASYPAVDPSLFAGKLSEEQFAEIQKHPDEPLFPRATMGAYPPGSAFKPFVALAAMDRGVVQGTMTRFRSPPVLEIDGRPFRNWNDRDEGLLDVRYALVRSSNPWFYQAGILTGGDHLLAAAGAYGFGSAPEIDLPVTGGRLPERKNVLSRQALANLSIGQGELLVSPLQLAIGMAGLSAGNSVPRARLRLQSQDPLSHRIKTTNPAKKISRLNLRRSDRDAVRDGMWGVVNHESGTGKSAARALPQVYGKTGTSQWLHGRNLAWFGGYVGSNSPRIAIVALVLGRSGESISGGKHAAPLVGQWVNEVYDNPDRYGVKSTVREPINHLKRSSNNFSPRDLTGLPPIGVPSVSSAAAEEGSRIPVASPAETSSVSPTAADYQVIPPAVNSMRPRVFKRFTP